MAGTSEIRAALDEILVTVNTPPEELAARRVAALDQIDAALDKVIDATYLLRGDEDAARYFEQIRETR